jgi:hypothetical protein
MDPLTTRDLWIIDQVGAALNRLVGDLVEHRAHCGSDPRACVGTDVAAGLDSLSPDSLRMLLEESIIRLANHHGSTITT